MKKNKITWTKIGNLKWSNDLGTMDWFEAKKLCKKLKGRLPTRIELCDLFDNHYEELQKLDDLGGYYWSATTVSYNTHSAWIVFLYNGYTSNNTKTLSGSYKVCCVRPCTEDSATADDAEGIRDTEKVKKLCGNCRYFEASPEPNEVGKCRKSALIIEQYLLKLFIEWKILNPVGLLSWIMPEIEEYGKQKMQEEMQKGRSEICQKKIEKMKDNISLLPKIKK